MKVVYAADDPLQAHAVANFLEEEGIPAVVVGEGMFPLRGYGASCAVDSLPQVCVTNDEDAPRALQLLRAHRVAVQEATPHTARRWLFWTAVCVFVVILLAVLAFFSSS